MLKSLPRKCMPPGFGRSTAQGVTSRHSEFGEELMVPYADLSESAKDLDRATVRTVYTAIQTTQR